MNNRFRDTVFGQVVRLLSRNRLLKFPNELDPTLWKQCVQRDATAASSSSEDHSGISDHTVAGVNGCGEKSQRQGADSTSLHKSGDKHSLHQGDPSHEKTPNFVLVDWYGLDDQDV
jgi:DHA1 family multidrug resistance protein-like MFS transporter